MVVVLPWSSVAFERTGDTAFAGSNIASEIGAGHGRTEERYVTAIPDPEGLPVG